MSRHALVVGIDRYESDPLAYCVSDAEAVRDALELPEYGFACTLLTNNDATARRIRIELENVLKEGNDLAVFYFAGHGAATDYGAFLVTPECKDRADDGFDLEFLTRMIQANSPSGASVVIILDCCHSGIFNIGRGALAVAMRADDLTPYVHQFSDRRALIAACMENQVADEDPGCKHGVFSRNCSKDE
jgi:eukaryotic-like serine/threonine-protein kinase